MRPRASGARRLARGLGWFSLALGAAELLAARQLARRLGMPGRERLVTTYGLREIGTGLGILLSRDPAPWIGARLGGDALDAGTLATQLDDGNPRRGSAVAAFCTVLAAAALDAACLRGLRAESRAGKARLLARYRPGQRSGWPRAAAEMRGAARDFVVPADFRIPEALRPFSAA